MTGPVDVHRRLVWSRSKLHRMRLGVYALGTAAAVVIVLLADKQLERFLAGAAGAVFVAFCFYEIYRLLEPNSALIELLPQGIIFRTTNEDFIIPWSEIHGVDTIDIHAEFRGREEVYRNVTVVLVSKFFYDRVIHERWMLMRGPGWDAHFIPKGDKVQIAIHHEILPNVTAEEVRRQVEERWKAFQKPPLSHSAVVRTADS